MKQTLYINRQVRYTATGWSGRAAFLFLCLLLGTAAGAQNPTLHLQTTLNASLEYIPGNQYLLGNSAQAVFINGMNNKPGVIALSRIHLQVMPDNFAPRASNLSTVYCTQAEVNDVLQATCPTLSTYFHASDARRTFNDEYVVCGYVMRTSEFSNCGGPSYEDAFILRTDNRGNVIWYKRYRPQQTGSGVLRFNTIIEDATTGNLIVGGERISGDAFVMGTTGTGNVIWEHNITATIVTQAQYYTYLPSSFSKITAFSSSQLPRQGYVLTGPAQQYVQYQYSNANFGGGMLLVVDATGMIYTNKLMTQELNQNSGFMKTIGVADAFDEHVVLTGASGGTHCYQHDLQDLMLMKIDPVGLGTPTFMKTYQHGSGSGCSGGTCSVGVSSCGTTVTLGQRRGDIYVGGYEADLYNSGAGAVYMQTNNSGVHSRYVPLNASHGTSTSAITYNSRNGYPVYSGVVGYTPSFLIKDNYNSDCDPDTDPVEVDQDLQYVDNTESPLPIDAIQEDLVRFVLPDTILLDCGYANKQAPTAIQTVRGKGLVIAPNPATDFVEIQMPLSMASGTINVYDVQGRLVSSRSFSSGNELVRLSVSGLMPGMYSVNVQSGGKASRATFVKE